MRLNIQQKVSYLSLQVIGFTSKTTSSFPERGCNLDEDDDVDGDTDGIDEISFVDTAIGEFKQVGGALADIVLSGSFVSTSSSSNDIMCVCTFFRDFVMEGKGSRK